MSTRHGLEEFYGVRFSGGLQILSGLGLVDTLVSLRRWEREDLRLKANLGYKPNSKPMRVTYQDPFSKITTEDITLW